MIPVLYSYFRSSAAYRVRIALNLKNIAYEQQAIHLVRDGGQQLTTGFKQVNPQGLVPVWDDGNICLGQSLAIIEYLDEAYQGIRLLPEDRLLRARVRQFSLVIACDIHPVNNLRILKYLSQDLKITDENKLEWIRHWISDGLQSLESLLNKETGRGSFCFGNAPTVADCCLIPQLFNARRFGVSLDAYPTLTVIESTCQELEAFQSAHPQMQPDSE